MPKYVEEAPRVSRVEVPSDLPDPAAEIKRGIKPGSVIESDEKGTNGKPRRFRLQDKRVIPALWREIGRPTATAAPEAPQEPDEEPDEDDESEEDEEGDEDEEDEEDTPPPPPPPAKRRTTGTRRRRTA